MIVCANWFIYHELANMDFASLTFHGPRRFGVRVIPFRDINATIVFPFVWRSCQQQCLLIIIVVVREASMFAYLNSHC